jgi:hypothetical protein
MDSETLTFDSSPAALDRRNIKEPILNVRAEQDERKKARDLEFFEQSQ